MSKKIKAERPYTLEKTGDGKVTMRFKMHRSPGGAPEKWMTIGVLMIIGGFFPGAITSRVFFGDDFNGTAFIVGWIASIVLPFILSNRAYKKQGAHGSKYTRMIFSRDEIETTYKKVLDRADIEGSWWRGADTSFTYTNNTGYKFGKAVAESKAKNGHHVGVTYGATEVPITHETLTENQAQKMADAVARWISNPDAFLAEADGATDQAQAA